MKVERLAQFGCLALALAAPAPGQESEIAVELENSTAACYPLLAEAQATAARIYAGIGLKIAWRSPSAAGIRIRFDTGVPEADHPGAGSHSAWLAHRETSCGFSPGYSAYARGGNR